MYPLQKRNQTVSMLDSFFRGRNTHPNLEIHQIRPSHFKQNLFLCLNNDHILRKTTPNQVIWVK